MNDLLWHRHDNVVLERDRVLLNRGNGTGREQGNTTNRPATMAGFGQIFTEPRNHAVNYVVRLCF